MTASKNGSNPTSRRIIDREVAYDYTDGYGANLRNIFGLPFDLEEAKDVARPTDGSLQLLAAETMHTLACVGHVASTHLRERVSHQAETARQLLAPKVEKTKAVARVFLTSLID